LIENPGIVEAAALVAVGPSEDEDMNSELLTDVAGAGLPGASFEGATVELTADGFVPHSLAVVPKSKKVSVILN
jgi:hypothetical protein